MLRIARRVWLHEGSCKQTFHKHFWECQRNEFRLCRNEAQTMLAGLCAVIKTSVSREYRLVYSKLVVSMFIIARSIYFVVLVSIYLFVSLFSKHGLSKKKIHFIFLCFLFITSSEWTPKQCSEDWMDRSDGTERLHI